MKWYWWVLIAVVIIIIIGFFVKQNRNSQVANNTVAPKGEFDPYVITPLTARK